MSLGETTIAITAARNVQVKQHLSIGSGIKSRPAAASLKKQPNSAPQKHDVHVCVCVCVCLCASVCCYSLCELGVAVVFLSLLSKRHPTKLNEKQTQAPSLSLPFSDPSTIKDKATKKRERKKKSGAHFQANRLRRSKRLVLATVALACTTTQQAQQQPASTSFR